MADVSPVTLSSKAKYEGIFDVGEWYNLMWDVFGGFGYEIWETRYKEKVVGDAKELDLYWTCFKDIDNYTRFEITADILIIGLKSVEVQKDGIKSKADKASIEIIFKSSLITDYDDRWSKSFILRMLKGFYNRYVYRPTFNHYKVKIYEEMYQIQNEVKGFFNLPRFM
jgi:hypothetical protein